MASICDFEPLWGEWKSVKLLGKGSFGRVYLAEKTELGTKYYSAIKHIGIPVDESQSNDLLDEGVVTDEETLHTYYEQVLHSLMDEIKINYELKGNTNIVSYEEHSVFTRTEQPGYDLFIKMELLTSLPEYMRSNAMTVEDVVKLGEDLCSALCVLQQKKIVHRDIKPANIFINNDGRFKLGDFGVARTMEKTLSNMSLKGTFSYMPPEIANGGEGDYRLDIYSLGLVMHWLLNEKRYPFIQQGTGAATHSELERAHSRRLQGEPLPKPTCADDELSAIILKACSFRAEDRYSDAEAFKNALTQYRESMTQERAQTVVWRGMAKVAEAQQEIEEQKENATFSIFGGQENPPADKAVFAEKDACDVTFSMFSTKTEEPVGKPKKKRRIPIWAIATAGALILTVILIFALVPKKENTPTNDILESVTEQVPTEEAVVITLCDDGIRSAVYATLGLPAGSDLLEQDMLRIEGLRISTDTGRIVTSLEDLQYLPNLKELGLQKQEIADFTPIAGLENLVNLNLGDCPIADESFLGDLSASVKNLDLRGTGISSVEFAAELPELTYLNISNCQVTDLSALADLEKLQTLDITGCPVRNTTAVKHVPTVLGKPRTNTTSTEKRPTSTSTSTPAPSVSTTVAVTKVAISAPTLTLDVGGSTKLTAEITPSNATNRGRVSWYASNYNDPGSPIVNINSNGHVVALRPGTASITAKCDGVSDTVLLTVY